MKILKVALIVVILIIVILAISGTNIFGAVFVSDISLEKKGDSTLVTIMANNPFQFNSSSVPAKEGRPFRILIDCKDALHNLAKYDFRNLPSGIVTSIRTSQYQTDPNRVVRIVLDVAKTVNYYVHTADNSLVITLVSMGEPDFETWSASGVTAPVTTTVEKAESTSPEQTTVSTSPETTVSQEPTETTTTGEPSSSTETTATLEQTVASTEPETTSEPASTSPLATEPVSPAPSSTFVEVPSPETMAASDTQPTSVASEAVDTTAPVTEATPTEETQTVVTDTTPTPTEPVTKAIVKKTPKKSPVTEEPKTDETAQSKAEVKVTPPTAITEEEGAPIVKVTPSQIQEKALQAIETFPKRRMIQYRSMGKRDPFSPLIGDKKVTEFGQAPIPSIENLRLVGVLQDIQGNKALLEDNRGYGYIMEPGDRVKNGSVILVDEDRVIFQIQEYGWSRNVALDLYNIENK